MTANDSGRFLLLAVSSYLPKGVQYIFHEQLPLTVEDFCRGTKLFVGDLMRVSRFDCTVPNFLEIPWAELVFIARLLQYCRALGLKQKKFLN